MKAKKTTRKTAMTDAEIKEAIKRDLLYSSDEGQIRELMAAEIDSSVKKGWEEV